MSDYSEILKELEKKKSKEKKICFKQLLWYPNINNRHNYKLRTIAMQLLVEKIKKI